MKKALVFTLLMFYTAGCTSTSPTEEVIIYQRYLWSSPHRSSMTGGQIHGDKEYCDHGSSYLLLVELGAPVKTWSLRPFGQSEDLNSPHYNDMTELCSQKQYKRFFFTEEDTLNQLESKVILEY